MVSGVDLFYFNVYRKADIKVLQETHGCKRKNRGECDFTEKDMEDIFSVQNYLFPFTRVYDILVSTQYIDGINKKLPRYSI